MSTDLIQRLRFLASGQDDVHSKAIDEAADALERMGRSLAIVQQHHATAWNRGHEAGMRANRDIAKQATDAVKRDAWGNSQLTEALLAAEAERDQLRAEVEALRADVENYVRTSSELAYELTELRADAERWRAMRGFILASNVVGEYGMRYTASRPHESGVGRYEWKTAETIDAAIDKARGA